MMNQFNLQKKYKWEELSSPLDTIIEEVPIVPNGGGDGTVYLALSARKTIIKLGLVDGNIYQYIKFNLVNPGKQLIGDQLIIISQPDTTNNDIEYEYDSNYFYITRCGGPDSPPTSNFDSGEKERDVTIFTYDGEVFCSTYDNC